MHFGVRVLIVFRPKFRQFKLEDLSEKHFLFSNYFDPFASLTRRWPTVEPRRNKTFHTKCTLWELKSFRLIWNGWHLHISIMELHSLLLTYYNIHACKFTFFFIILIICQSTFSLINYISHFEINSVNPCSVFFHVIVAYKKKKNK